MLLLLLLLFVSAYTVCPENQTSHILCYTHAGLMAIVLSEPELAGFPSTLPLHIFSLTPFHHIPVRQEKGRW